MLSNGLQTLFSVAIAGGEYVVKAVDPEVRISAAVLDARFDLTNGWHMK